MKVMTSVMKRQVEVTSEGDEREGDERHEADERGVEGGRRDEQQLPAVLHEDFWLYISFCLLTIESDEILDIIVCAFFYCLPHFLILNLMFMFYTTSSV